MSCFVVLSEADGVIAAAHAFRCAVTPTQRGCSMRRLDTLPESLTLTFDRDLDRTSTNVILWHATLAPTEPMPFSSFFTALRSWQSQLCAINGAAECPPEIFFDKTELGTVAAFLKPYISQKLAPYAHDQQRRLPAGGSPGT